jgi:hypothetical protein
VAEDFDLDRVINDPAYRRRVIARLNFNAPQGESRPINDQSAPKRAPTAVNWTLADQDPTD